jgi:hypothetical protein
LVSGILSYIFLPLIGAIAAIITGGIAKRQIRESSGRLTGKGMANWGVILGWVNIGLGLLAGCLIILAFAGVFGSTLFLLFPNFQ